MVERFLESPFRDEATYVLSQAAFRATRGRTETTDHPPIYPTGVVDPKKLRPDNAAVYELVVRRFGSDARVVILVDSQQPLQVTAYFRVRVNDQVFPLLRV